MIHIIIFIHIFFFAVFYASLLLFPRESSARPVSSSLLTHFFIIIIFTFTWCIYMNICMYIKSSSLDEEEKENERKFFNVNFLFSIFIVVVVVFEGCLQSVGAPVSTFCASWLLVKTNDRLSFFLSILRRSRLHAWHWSNNKLHIASNE